MQRQEPQISQMTQMTENRLRHLRHIHGRLQSSGFFNELSPERRRTRRSRRTLSPLRRTTAFSIILRCTGQDPSTPVSMPSLRRFRPQQNSLARSVPYSLSGGAAFGSEAQARRGAAGPCICDFSSRNQSVIKNSSAPSSSSNASFLSTPACSSAALRNPCFLLLFSF
jgi:hypothetical protein